MNRALLQPLQALRHRAEEWGRRRAGPPQRRVTVNRRKIYIVPTRFGIGFALLTLLMLLAATNYSNSMAFALCFLLASLGLVCMHTTHANLVGLQLSSLSGDSVFAGETAHFGFSIANESAAARLGIELRWRESERRLIHDIAPGDTARFDLTLPAQRRGRLRAPLLQLSTTAPLGLFRAWTWLAADAQIIAYPQPAAAQRPFPNEGSAGYGGPRPRAGDDDFAGFRDYVAGDPARLIHWKSLPRTGRALVRRFEQNTAPELWLDWNALPGLDTEARLSQLTRWIIDAEVQGSRYGLRLPNGHFQPEAGAGHRQRCLEALALFDEPAARRQAI